MSTETKYPPYCNPEIWGGIECTINRVNNVYRDQLSYAGHYLRENDIEAIASLGIRKLRYPVLWEHHETLQGQDIDWNWTSRQLALIREKGIEPIAGLVHHGSGPVYTDLYDVAFPEKLAVFAKKVAQQFPWIQYYTPVNEPLTTARFSGLYGFWYPHHKNETSFIRILLNQVKGVVLAMKAIREINPDAKLVQTEDLSKTHSTIALSYQAEFENKRRWLSTDLLCGIVDRKHYFWKYFIDAGILKEELQFFIDNPCFPAVMGFNYYVTSERFLDEQLDNYPDWTHGGNYKERYADTEAVRAGIPPSPATLLKEAWDRYKLPIAITECHISCSREEQLRWFNETWEACCSLKKEGIDIVALTAWSLLGAYDWNSLLVTENRHYEPGAFEVNNDKLRPTALTKLIRSLAKEGEYSHPLLLQKGWWHRKQDHNMEQSKHIKTPPLLIIGRNGTLGQAFVRICTQRSIPFIALSRKDLDISNEQDIARAIETYRPWAVINAAGYVRVDEAEVNSNECFQVNAAAPGMIAHECQKHGVKFMTFSSDLVFDGIKQAPYHEADGVQPLNVYGESKAAGEKLVTSHNPGALIIRTSAFFGPWDKYNFVYAVLNSLGKNEPFYMPNDVIVSPTYVPDLANTALDLFIDEEVGIWHLSNEGMLTWAELAELVADRGGYQHHQLIPQPLAEMGWKAPRPKYSVLQSERGIKLPGIDHAMKRYFEQRTV